MATPNGRTLLAPLLLAALGGCAAARNAPADPPNPAAARPAGVVVSHDEPDDEDAVFTVLKEQWELLKKFCREGFPPWPN